MKVIFATNNEHKISEVRKICPGSIEILSLEQSGIVHSLPENQNTLEGNAEEKVRAVHRLTGKNCFAEDTGLEVYSLGGKPGVFTARYAGPKSSARDNRNLLLSNLKAVENRRARFRSVISLIWENKVYFFEGICEGRISNSERGTAGFGYDPIFIPEGYDQTFAELDESVKNRISHRYFVTAKLVDFLLKVLQ